MSLLLLLGPPGTPPTPFLPRVREKPPVRTHVDVESPSGRHYRWGPDEPDPANTFSGLTYGDTMPGGFEHGELTLPRKSGFSYSDNERLSTVTVRGPGGEVAWEGRLEGAAKASGDEMSVAIRAVGWQAALDDDKSAVMVYIDRSLAGWGDTSLARKRAVGAAGRVTNKISAGGQDGLVFEFPDQQLTTADQAELFYELPAGVLAGQFTYQADREGTFTDLDGGNLFSAATTDFASPTPYSLTVDDALHDQALSAHRYLLLQVFATGTVTPSAGTQETFEKVAVYGNHGLDLAEISGEPDGILASTIVAHAVSRWAPSLTFTTGTTGTVRPSSFPISHATFPDLTTAGEIVKAVTRFELQDWAVWENKRFYWYDRGTRGRVWRARVRPARLQETGPQVDRLWESIVVQYQDEAGTARTVGPPGSGADTESEFLKDTDPDNPANQLGITRRDVLQMGTASPNSAIEVGRQFLEQTKLLDRSGQATFVGHVEDDRGVIHPYWKVRAGDYVSFVDANDTGLRRIVKTAKNDGTRTCQVDLDAPPEGLQELLERLQAVLVRVGIF